jgi:catechol 2,3-dioxygenase-like lactoylglutathione lyase family enzyme
MAEPETGRLHHLAVGSPDVERLARFYREVFGLSERARKFDEAGQLRSIWLDLGGPILMLERSHGAMPRVEGVRAGPFLLAFRVSREERSRLERELEARGHPIEARTAFTSYARDVDGNRVGFSHYPEP